MKIVVKVGTSTLAHSTGLLNIRHVESLCKVISDLKNAGHDVVYYKQPGEKHGGFLPEVREKLHVFLENCILGNEG